MRGLQPLGRLALGLAMAGAFGASPGCTYLRHRADDAAETIDLGVTWSARPQWAAYGCFASIASAGVGRVDGQFAGIGGGQVGTVRHFSKELGLLAWSYEEVGWGEFDAERPETLNRQHIGAVGWLTELPRRPTYAPA